MSKQLSFAKNEQKILPSFRQKINLAESTEDTKKFFTYTVKELFDSVSVQKTDIHYNDNDIVLTPTKTPFFRVSESLLSSEKFTSIWNNSDLPNIIARLAKSAMNRHKRLEKHTEKTEAKIRM